MEPLKSSARPPMITSLEEPSLLMRNQYRGERRLALWRLLHERDQTDDDNPAVRANGTVSPSA